MPHARSVQNHFFARAGGEQSEPSRELLIKIFFRHSIFPTLIVIEPLPLFVIFDPQGMRIAFYLSVHKQCYLDSVLFIQSNYAKQDFRRKK